MKNTKISDLFTCLGIGPYRRGYHFLLYLVELAAAYNGQPFPSMKELYQKTAEHFQVTPSIVQYDIRTVIRSYWNQTESTERFTAVTHYPVPDNLTVKEFVSVLAEYVSNHL